ncbi:MAG TPA: SDR family oxidoreductase [Dehalococcoidia bacterium]|nr:SDR family oxidoreductase [Dehalococcoidia bacterium]
MAKRLAGKVAIVTGAGRGIGRGEALALASEGARVVVNDLGGAVDGSGASTSPAEEVVVEIKKLGGEAVTNYDSVATRKGGENIVKTAIDNFGKLDILVNNAGILRDRMLFNMGEEDWDLVLKVHLYGHFYTIRAVSPLFRQQRYGRIINTSSVAGLNATTYGQANYGAAKEGIVGLTRKVARDMGRYGVTCNCIRPNAGTRLTLSDEMKKARPDAMTKFEQMKPEDIAPLVVWLASDDAANVNGRTFYVERGRIGLYSEPVLEKQLVKAGGWTIDELFMFMPTALTKDLVNPDPPQPK